jgi:hypothetical protein
LSVESHRPLTDFTVAAFSLSFELTTQYRRHAAAGRDRAAVERPRRNRSDRDRGGPGGRGNPGSRGADARRGGGWRSRAGMAGLQDVTRGGSRNRTDRATGALPCVRPALYAIGHRADGAIDHVRRTRPTSRCRVAGSTRATSTSSRRCRRCSARTSSWATCSCWR